MLSSQNYIATHMMNIVFQIVLLNCTYITCINVYATNLIPTYRTTRLLFCHANSYLKVQYIVKTAQQQHGKKYLRMPHKTKKDTTTEKNTFTWADRFKNDLLIVDIVTLYS